MNQMGTFPKKALALADGLLYEAELGVFQIAKSTVNDASGTAGNPGAEIVLFEQQNALAGTGTLSCHGHAVDAASDDHHMEVLPFQRWSRFDSQGHERKKERPRGRLRPTGG